MPTPPDHPAPAASLSDGGPASVARVLLVTGVYPPQIGGPSQQARVLARDLAARGVEVQVVTQGPQPGREVREGVPVLNVSSRRERGLWRKLRNYLGIYRELRDEIRRFRPDVVHMQTVAGPLALLTGLAVRRTGVASLLKYTADPAVEQAFRELPQGGAPVTRMTRGWMGRALFAAARLVVFRLYHRVWATTPVLARHLRERLGVPWSRVLLLPNFIDLDAFVNVARPAPSTGIDIRLLTVGRLHPIKGIEVCVEALARLDDLPVKLRIVGGGELPAEYEEFLRDRVRELGVEDRVEFVGALPPESLAREYALADAFVLGSFYEAFGLVVAEAMAAGVPVVVTSVGGLPHVVADGSAGMLVPPGDPDSMAAAVRRVVTDAGLRDRLVRAGKDRSRDFGADACIDRLMDEYGRLRRDEGRRQPVA